MKIGLALGSGGARGLAHLGVLEALEEAGLRPHCIAGTSMGAIIGALYAEHGSVEIIAERLKTYYDNPDFQASWEPFIDDEERVPEGGIFQELRRSLQKKILTFRTFTSPSQQKSVQLLDPLRTLFGSRRVEELGIPFAAVAIDLLSGEPEVFNHGPLVEAVYASSAIPGVFPPMEWQGKRLIDGGGSYRVPIGECRNLGANFVIAIDIPSFSKDPSEFERGLEILMRSDAIARNRLNRFVLKEADFVITPEVGRFHWANFLAETAIRNEGLLATRSSIAELQAALKSANRPSLRLRRKLRSWFSR
ncbi:MAG: patatin-like phospholipase family protein [Candidatus Krumholzibacteria bacterium]|jgi:NTE family protein|nr:patatin-like phospholipase family protein [Candidatus Krumholzibacteria bacterium]MDP6669303.1 patatin-like phospholipase family protein [Candidatus Krumholzibacteria bacterium]MDP6797329.1 patatin-like phospholipase family protein [Candidatus Krumholzibacteria bacterium]MDP7021526.1 patatin-like phospholipase family protein [Candidatus Krumholzibacteria bacterium]